MYSGLTTGLETYSFDVPNIYQIELVGGLCNLRCPECPVTLGFVKRKEKFFDVDFIEEMVNRGDFDNTFYVELQMYGEPLLHPDFDRAVEILKNAGLLVGVSTNGTIWRDGLRDVDFVTLSADSVRYRHGRDDEKFSEVMKRLLEETEAKVDIQIVEVEDWKKQLVRIEEVVKEYEDRVLVRTVPDCFIPYYTDYSADLDKDVCVNIFLSVSIHSDGDVVPCCFAWNKDLVFGNIYTESLKDIWKGEKRLKFVKNWICGKLPNHCRKCKYRSPQLLHWRFWVNWVRRGWL